MSHTFETTASWTGGLEGQGSLATQGLESQFSAPKLLGGPGVGTNPEELLLSAASTCFLITLGAVLTRRKISFVRLSLRSELEVAVDGGLQVKRVKHYPTVQLAPGASAAIRELTVQAVTAAETHCLVARAMAGNVAFETELEISGEI